MTNEPPAEDAGAPLGPAGRFDAGVVDHDGPAGAMERGGGISGDTELP